jgi:LysM repeat protein
MNNMLKTIFVVSVMGGALYGAYVLLNENEFRSRQQAAQGEAEPRFEIDPGSEVGPGGSPSDDAEPAPWDFGSTSSEPAAPQLPPPLQFPPETIAPGGVTPIPPAGLPSMRSGSTSVPEPLPPNTTPVDPYAATAPHAGLAGTGPDFEQGSSYSQLEDASTSEEPADLTVPPDLGATDYPATQQGEFQMADGSPAAGPTPDFDGASFDDASFDDRSSVSLAASESNSTGLGGAPGVGAGAGKGSAAIEAARQSYLRAVDAAKAHVAQQNYRDALASLSPIYGNPDLPSPEKEELGDLLDALAAKVIYSPEHLHQPAYVVQPGDTLDSIAAGYSITPEFLARINGLDPTNRAAGEPGSSLKVVRGPFRAEVRLKSNLAGTLTLYLGELYAGRFDVELGQDNPPFPGKYKVHDKQVDRPFYTAAGQLIPADSPENPYGGRWIDLGSGISLHGGPATAPPGGRLGCMALPGEGQASDLFAILSLSSTVEVRQ